MKVAEIFYGLQGEIDVGMPAVFIRLSGCNLIKDKNGCEWCDTVWAEKENKDMTTIEIITKISQYKCNNVIITGGEPLVQVSELTSLVEELNDEGYNISIETNGTILKFSVFNYVSKINCSPKRQCINYEVLKGLLDANIRFKFVYDSKKDKWWEAVIEKLEIEPDKVWIMPQGKTQREQLNNMKEVWEYCTKKGYHFSPRMHVLVYDTRRGV